jgi:hypothetical protein
MAVDRVLKAGATTWSVVNAWMEDRLDRTRARRMIRNEAAYFAEKDAKSFAAAALPEGEEVGIRCIWVLEPFLASHSDALHRQIADLGLDGNFGMQPGPVEALESARLRVHGGGGWRGLGYLIPRGAKASRSLGTRAVALPEGVTSVFLTVQLVTSSTSILAAQFRFDEETARGIEVPFRTHYRTTVQSEAGITRIPNGTHLRQSAVDEYREMLRRRCSRWMSTHFPGAFAGLGTQHASAELLTTAVADPRLGRVPVIARSGPQGDTGGSAPEDTWVPPNPGPRGFDETDYATHLRLTASHDLWDCLDLPGLTARQSPGRLDGPAQHVVLGTRIRDFSTDEDLTILGGEARSASAVTSYLYYFDRTLGVFALWRLMGDYEAALARLRDRLARVRLNDRGAIGRLHSIGRDLLAMTRDLRPLCNDILLFENQKSHLWDVYEFEAIDPRERPYRPKSLFESLAAARFDAARRLLATEAELRSMTESMGNLVAANANLHAAQRNLLLQVVVVLLTLVTIVVGVFALPASIKELLWSALGLARR